jgi:hypothetical protein
MSLSLSVHQPGNGVGRLIASAILISDEHELGCQFIDCFGYISADMFACYPQKNGFRSFT